LVDSAPQRRHTIMAIQGSEILPNYFMKPGTLISTA